MYNHCCQNTANTTNTTNATGGLISQIIGGICGCRPRQDTVTFPVYATVTVPVSMLQGGTTNNGTSTGNGTTGQGQNGCGCGCYNPCGFGRCGRGVATSIVTGGTGADDTLVNRYGYYPYGYYPCGQQGGCCGR